MSDKSTKMGHDMANMSYFARKQRSITKDINDAKERGETHVELPFQDYDACIMYELEKHNTRVRMLIHPDSFDIHGKQWKVWRIEWGESAKKCVLGDGCGPCTAKSDA